MNGVLEAGGGAGHRNVETLRRKVVEHGGGAVGEVESPTQQQYRNRLPEGRTSGCAKVWRERSRRLRGGGESARRDRGAGDRGVRSQQCQRAHEILLEYHRRRDFGGRRGR